MNSIFPYQTYLKITCISETIYDGKSYWRAGFHTGFFDWGGTVFSHASTKHVNVGGLGASPLGNVFKFSFCEANPNLSLMIGK